MAINHDQLFKELLTTFFVEFIEIFFPEVLEYLDTSDITFVDKEVFTDITQGQKKISDVIALTKYQAQDYSFLVHIEAQASNLTDFNQRMFRYFCSLYLKYNLPIFPIAVFSYDSPKRPDKDTYFIDFPEGRERYYPLQFKYKVVQLNRLNWRDFLKQKNPVAIAQRHFVIALMSKMNIKKSDHKLCSISLNPASIFTVYSLIFNLELSHASRFCQMVQF